MSKNPKARDLSGKEALAIVIITLMTFPATLLWVYLGTVAWDRQHSVVILETASVFDQWDAFGLPQPQLIGVVERGATLPLVARFHSIEGGGIRIKLPDRRVANLVAFLSTGDYRLTRGFEPIGILIFVELGVMLGWEWLFLLGKKRFAARLWVAVIILPASVLTNVLMLHGAL